MTHTRKTITAREARERQEAKRAEAKAQRDAARAAEAAKWPTHPFEFGRVPCSKEWCHNRAHGIYIWSMSKRVVPSCGEHPRMRIQDGVDASAISLTALAGDPQGWLRWLTETDAYSPAAGAVRRFIERNRAEGS